MSASLGEKVCLICNVHDSLLCFVFHNFSHGVRENPAMKSQIVFLSAKSNSSTGKTFQRLLAKNWALHSDGNWLKLCRPQRVNSLFWKTLLLTSSTIFRVPKILHDVASVLKKPQAKNANRYHRYLFEEGCEGWSEVSQMDTLSRRRTLVLSRWIINHLLRSGRHTMAGGI